MRPVITVCILLLISILANAQNTMTTSTLSNEVFKGVLSEMQDIREITSGAKRKVKYEGHWPAEMEGAFEHAVRIWEEVRPITLPINITAILGSIRNQRVLSQVELRSTDYDGHTVNDIGSPNTMVKSVCLQQYHSGRNDRYFDELSDTTIFSKDDIIITYNSSHLKEFDFSIDGNLMLICTIL